MDYSQRASFTPPSTSPAYERSFDATAWGMERDGRAPGLSKSHLAASCTSSNGGDSQQVNGDVHDHKEWRQEYSSNGQTQILNLHHCNVSLVTASGSMQVAPGFDDQTARAGANSLADIDLATLWGLLVEGFCRPVKLCLGTNHRRGRSRTTVILPLPSG